ncbi:MAG: hypothetical protein QGG40_19780, partial [Myxococcota bacterium]|nr:hypothetical protein [Myxococcota bacterium]
MSAAPAPRRSSLRRLSLLVLGGSLLAAGLLTLLPQDTQPGSLDDPVVEVEGETRIYEPQSELAADAESPRRPRLQLKFLG